MPVHRVQRSQASKVVDEFEAAGEEIVHCSIEGDNYVIFTRHRGLVIEDPNGDVTFVKVGDKRPKKG